MFAFTLQTSINKSVLFSGDLDYFAYNESLVNIA